MKKDDLIEKGTYLIPDSKYQKYDTAIEINEKNKANIVKFNDRINSLETTLNPEFIKQVIKNKDDIVNLTNNVSYLNNTLIALTTRVDTNEGEIAYLEGETGRIDGVVNDLAAETPTDLSFDSNGFKLMHDGQEISGQVNKLKINGATYDAETNTINVASGGSEIFYFNAKEKISNLFTTKGERTKSIRINNSILKPSQNDMIKKIDDYVVSNIISIEKWDSPSGFNMNVFNGDLSKIHLITNDSYTNNSYGLCVQPFTCLCQESSKRNGYDLFFYVVCKDKDIKGDYEPGDTIGGGLVNGVLKMHIQNAGQSYGWVDFTFFNFGALNPLPAA